MSLLDKASLIVTPNAYKESKLYSVVPSTGTGDIDVVRATTATRVNSSGLIEVVPRNLLTYSNDFLSNWGSDGTTTITANSGISPDGTNNATKVITVGANGYGYRILPTISAGNYTYSLYIKSSVNTNINIAIDDVGGSGVAQINIPVSNNWQRFSVSANITNGTFVVIDYSALVLGIDYYMYGAQLEQGSTATEYFPTTTRLNIPRIDYTNGSCPSLLLEPQRTNLLIGSNAFVGAGWAISGSATINSNFAISPDGTQNSAKLTTPTQGISGIYQVISGTASIDYSRSLYIKSVSGNTETIRITDPYGSGTDGILVTINGQWNRYTFTNPLSGGVNGGIWLNNIPTAGIYIYGSQIEQGSYATSYIPTVASTVTRANDIIFKTGISSLIGQTEGTVFVDVEDLIKDTFLFSFNESTTSSVSILKNSSNEIQCQVWGSTLITILSGSVLNERLKIAFAYKSGNIAVYINGIQIGTSSTTFTFGTTMDTLFLPYRNTYYAVSETAKYNSVQLYKTRLTNTELAQLTTL